MTRFRTGAVAGSLLLALFGSGCTSRQGGGSPVAPQGAAARFQRQLDSVKALLTDTAQSQGLRALYVAAAPDARRALFLPMLKTASDLLFYHTAADTLLLPFHQGLCADPVLLPAQRARAALQVAAFYAHIAGDADSASAYLARAAADPVALDDTLRVKIAATQAQIYQVQGNLPAAATSLYNAIRQSERMGDSGLVASSHVNLANVYRAMEDFLPAAQHRKIALKYFASAGDDAKAFIAATGLAADYTALLQLDSARRYIAQSEALLGKGVHNPMAEYALDVSAGGLYVNLKDYDSAIRWFDRAKILLPQLQDPAQETYFLLASSRAYAFRRNVAPEMQHIQSTLPDLLSAGDLQAAREAYLSLHVMAAQRGEAGHALDYYLRYDSLRTLLSNDRNRASVAELAARYGAEKQNLIIKLQERDLRHKRFLNGILALSLLSIVLAAVVVAIRYRLNDGRRKARWQDRFTAEMLRHTEAERGRIAMDLHDGIGHDLLTLKNSLHQPVRDNEARVDTILNNIRRLGRALHPVMLDKIGLEHSIYSLCEQITASGQLFVSADIAYEKQLTPECELQLYRIIQESLSNAVKYAEAHAAKVSIQRQPHALQVTVVDNGKGFDVAAALASDASFGLHSILERSKVLGGRALFSSGQHGTTLALEIPLA